jgi:hypothetical protein
MNESKLTEDDIICCGSVDAFPPSPTRSNRLFYHHRFFVFDDVNSCPKDIANRDEPPPPPRARQSTDVATRQTQTLRCAKAFHVEF